MASRSNKENRTEFPLGTGMAEQARNVVRNRGRNIDAMVDNALGVPKTKTKKPKSKY